MTMYGTGYRKPTGIEYGFAQRGEGGKTKFLFVNYFEERTEISPDVDMVKRLSDRQKMNCEADKKSWDNFNPSSTDLKDIDKQVTTLFKKIRTHEAFNGHPLSEK